VLTAVALAGALALDALAGEPPRRFHPVALFGRLVEPVDGEWRRPQLAGTLVAATLPGLGAAVAGGVVWLAGSLHSLSGVAAAAGLLFVTTSLRRLVAAARRVVALSETDLGRARAELRALAGRPASDLSAGQVRSAAVESLAENLADGLVAPLLGYVLFALAATAAGLGSPAALAAGCAGAAWVKAVNTLDSMLGYPSKPVGRAPARLDDAVMWAPARLAALLLVAVAARPDALSAATAWLPAVASPNAGWPMGTLAAALDVRLEKPGAYVLNPTAPLPTVADTRRATRLVAVAGVLAYLLAAALTALPGVVV